MNWELTVLQVVYIHLVICYVC